MSVTTKLPLDLFVGLAVVVAPPVDVLVTSLARAGRLADPAVRVRRAEDSGRVGGEVLDDACRALVAVGGEAGRTGVAELQSCLVHPAGAHLAEQHLEPGEDHV